MARFCFTRALIAPDEHHPTLGALARRIQALRLARPSAERGLELKPVRLGERGVRPATEAVEVNALDAGGNPQVLLGYAFAAGRTGAQLEQALRHALATEAAPGLVADPDAGRDAA